MLNRRKSRLKRSKAMKASWERRRNYIATETPKVEVNSSHDEYMRGLIQPMPNGMDALLRDIGNADRNVAACRERVSEARINLIEACSAREKLRVAFETLQKQNQFD